VVPADSDGFDAIQPVGSKRHRLRRARQAPYPVWVARYAVAELTEIVVAPAAGRAVLHHGTTVVAACADANGGGRVKCSGAKELEAALAVAELSIPVISPTLHTTARDWRAASNECANVVVAGREVGHAGQ
jgi:hypothetical protein